MLLSAIAALDDFVWPSPPLISETSGVFTFWQKRKICQKPTFLLHTSPLHCFYVNYIHIIDSNYNNGEILLRKEFRLQNSLLWHRNPHVQNSCSTCLFLVGWTNCGSEWSVQWNILCSLIQEQLSGEAEITLSSLPTQHSCQHPFDMFSIKFLMSLMGSIWWKTSQIQFSLWRQSCALERSLFFLLCSCITFCQRRWILTWSVSCRTCNSSQKVVSDLSFCLGRRIMICNVVHYELHLSLRKLCEKRIKVPSYGCFLSFTFSQSQRTSVFGRRKKEKDDQDGIHQDIE